MRECGCVCVNALRIASMDKILHFINTLIVIIINSKRNANIPPPVAR